ncbi:hypothetical protein DICVIV_01631 [Dictyocaulus viviparus]|uniref:G-protein coupled receptors family 1 profile domain-containing protein n=1 Tax=Dictyocaulus viviparus TaxID=29172 RepID=A0A0D8YC66_DICVI|nr:hypothetical protein DICVIV_01631 [Dictyocaulus viviparus]
MSSNPISRCRSRSDSSQHHNNEIKSNQTKIASAPSLKNGRFSKTSQLNAVNDRKSEKERRKNERKQESKAAKTLSAILAAFIVTWTPYNGTHYIKNNKNIARRVKNYSFYEVVLSVIVCYEAFLPNSIPNYLFAASYFLCYINSTINPFCYALCNASCYVIKFKRNYSVSITLSLAAQPKELPPVWIMRYLQEHAGDVTQYESKTKEKTCLR